MNAKSKKILMIMSINKNPPRPRPILDILNQNFDMEFIFIGKGGTESISREVKERSNIIDVKHHRISKIGFIDFFRLQFILKREILRVNPDIILTTTQRPLHTKISFVMSKIFKRKIIVITETWKENPYLSYPVKFYHAFSRFVLKHADAVFAQGDMQIEYCKKIGVDEKKIQLFPHISVDLMDKGIDNELIEHYKKMDKKIILFVGRIVQQKGIDILLKAFKRLKDTGHDDIYLLLLGEGKDRVKFEDLVKEKHLNDVEFYGYVKPDDLPSFLSITDIFVLPSKLYKGYPEGWGMVLNEAASMRVPIVTTDVVGASKNLVDHGKNGFVIKNNDVVELYDALVKIIDDDRLILTMSEESRKKFENYNDPETVISSLNRAIKHMYS